MPRTPGTRRYIFNTLTVVSLLLSSGLLLSCQAKPKAQHSTARRYESRIKLKPQPGIDCSTTNAIAIAKKSSSRLDSIAAYHRNMACAFLHLEKKQYDLARKYVDLAKGTLRANADKIPAQEYVDLSQHVDRISLLIDKLASTRHIITEYP